MKLLHAAVILFLVCVAVVCFQFKKWTDDQGPLFDSVVVEIPKGASSQKVAGILFDNGVGS